MFLFFPTYVRVCVSHTHSHMCGEREYSTLFFISPHDKSFHILYGPFLCRTHMTYFHFFRPHITHTQHNTHEWTTLALFRALKFPPISISANPIFHPLLKALLISLSLSLIPYTRFPLFFEEWEYIKFFTKIGTSIDRSFGRNGMYVYALKSPCACCCCCCCGWVGCCCQGILLSFIRFLFFLQISTFLSPKSEFFDRKSEKTGMVIQWTPFIMATLGPAFSGRINRWLLYTVIFL